MGLATIPHDVSSAVRTVSTAMFADVGGLAGRMAERLLTAVRDLDVDNLAPLVREVCEANCTTLLSGLMRATPVEYLTVTPEVSAGTRTIIRARVPFTAQVRGTHLGQALFVEEWVGAAAEHLPPDERTAAVLAATRYTAVWADQLIRQISADYDESTHWLHHAGSPTTVELARRLLDGDADAARRVRERHGYDLRGSHRACVLRCISDDAAGVLGEQVAAIRRAVPGPALVVVVDQATVWLWSQVDPAAPGPVWELLPDVHVAVGRTAAGASGFRLGHQQAQDVDRLAAATGRRGTTTYDDVDVATLCAGGLATARRFVAAELGGLAGPEPAAETARTTVRTFLHHGSNYRSTARELGLHHNSVIYRVQQAERLLGRPIGERPLALGVALHLHDALDAPS